MFKVTIGEEGLNNTWQAPFPKATPCCHCKGESRIGFVVFEEPAKNTPICEQNFVESLHPNSPGGEGFWLHDCCAVAVYFCRKCLNPTALYNQG